MEKSFYPLTMTFKSWNRSRLPRRKASLNQAAHAVIAASFMLWLTVLSGRSVEAAPQGALPQSCQPALQQARTVLARNGIKVSQVKILPIQGYKNVPQNAPLRVAFSVSQMPKTKDIYLKTATALNQCERVGLVTIGQNQSGTMISLGRIKDKLEPFRCTNHAARPLEWGFDLCSF
ncbi:hypothetical protein ACQ4M3_13350 [Leptolyngbya sp. AN03gr2]|uniref:hypothetical protein n=1 Tax=unclassified Leptolyngbya TaxID=2650499 RepID=UPI003D31DF0D